MRNILGRRRDADPGGLLCRMCGTAVVIGVDGRCPLGHRVDSPASAQPRLQIPWVGDAPPMAPLPPAPDRSPVPRVVAPTVGADGQAPSGDGAFPADEPAPTYAPSDSGLRSALEELLAWDEPAPSVLDVSVDELPAPTAPAVSEPYPIRGNFVDEQAEEEEEEAAEVARRRRLAAMFGGGGAALLAVCLTTVALVV